MRLGTLAVALALTLGVVLPAQPAMGSWGASGTHEPDTSFDVLGGRMFENPDVTTGMSVQKVYFDAFNTMAPTALNPNAAALETRLQAFGQTRFHAILGVWKDCNRDGYIGNGDNALREYRSELLVDTGVCPPKTTTPTFNDGTWVIELLPLANPDPCGWQNPPPPGCPQRNAYDPTSLDANGTRVWGDLGAPGEEGAGGECRLLPMPEGTTSSSGRLVAFADCLAHHQAARAFNDAAHIVDPENEARLQFEDPNHPESSSSALNQNLPANAFGNPDNGKSGLAEQDANDPAFRVWDCSPGTHTSPENRTLAPAIQSPTGSYWDALVATQEGVNGDCDPQTNNTLRAAYPLLDREAGENVDPNHRTRNNVVFRYYAAQRGATAPGIEPPLGRTAPDDFGVGALRVRDPTTPGRALGPEWIADESYVSNLPFIRSDATPQRAAYYTFYAYLTPATIAKHNLRLPNAAVAVYGSEMCKTRIGPGAPDAGGWACDPAAWWTKGNPTQYDGTPLGQTVGAPYQLRDVDCIDGQTSLGITEGACA